MIITPKMAKHVEEYYDVLGLTDKPFWKDACQHDADAYVCSFIIEGFFHRKRDYERKIDMYVFSERVVSDQSLCLRTGDEDGNYCAPGGVTDFMINNKNGRRDYRSIVDLLCYLGRIKWEPVKF